MVGVDVPTFIGEALAKCRGVLASDVPGIYAPPCAQWTFVGGKVI